jgi:cobalamin biosynthesis protein CbiG
MIGKSGFAYDHLACNGLCSLVAAAQTIPDGAAIDGGIGKIISRTHANGMTVAVIDHAR